MSAVKRIRPASYLALVEGVRGFRLVVTPGRGETFGVTLEETYGENGGTITAPVTGTFCAKVSCVSPVPGGISTTR